jgi:hypothetical protein
MRPSHGLDFQGVGLRVGGVGCRAYGFAVRVRQVALGFPIQAKRHGRRRQAPPHRRAPGCINPIASGYQGAHARASSSVREHVPGRTRKGFLERSAHRKKSMPVRLLVLVADSDSMLANAYLGRGGQSVPSKRERRAGGRAGRDVAAGG